MNLISELQKDILDEKASLSTILRKAKVFASTLRNDEFKKWVENELNGYRGNKEEVPDYRRGHAESRGDFVGPFGSGMKNVPIPTLNLPEEIKAFANEMIIAEGVRALESTLQGDSSSFNIPWPTDIVAILSGQIFRGYVCLSAWKSLSRGQIEQVLDTVRNRLLSFVLDLKEKYPEISKSEEAISGIPKEQVASSFNTYIFGSYNVVASGIGIDQKVHQQIARNDLDALLKYLENIGVPRDDTRELEKAIKADGSKTEQNKFGPKVAEWIGKMIKKILEGAWNVSISTAPELLTKALSRYYGWE